MITSLTVGCLALVFGAADAAATPTPDFTVDPTPVVAWEPATFTSTSTPTPPANPGDPAPVITNVEWDFNHDGTFEETGTSVKHTFELTAGATIDVVMRVTDDSGDAPAELTRQVDVNPPTPPTADFAVSPSPPVANAAAIFTSTSSTVEGHTITSWQWDFDNGAFHAIGPTAVYPFPSPGNHTVSLTVVDSRGVSAGTGPREMVVSAPPMNAPPIAAFTWFPTSPLVGEKVNLTSYSSDAEGALATQEWDLDGDGDFGDESGPVVRDRVFTVAGKHTVSLRVTDAQGSTDEASAVIDVQPSPMLRPIPNQPSSNKPPPTSTQQPFLRLLTPFPIVRLQGAVVKQGTRIRRLTVRAPKGSRIVVQCRGRRCPTKRLTKVADRRTLRFRALERVLPPRSLLQVFVRRGDRIGKYTSFLIRRKRVPKRVDGCLLPSSRRAVTCPED